MISLRRARYACPALLAPALVAAAMLVAACSNGGVRTTPVAGPSANPSGGPSAKPSSNPSAKPSAGPSANPSGSPSPSGSSTPAASPTPVDSNHVAFVVQIAPEALTAAPNVTPSAVNIYVTGQQTTNGACSASTFLEVIDASGDTAPFPTGGSVTAIPFYGNGTTSGNRSQVIQLPQLCSGRIYISVNGPLSITSTSGPAPWAATGGASAFPEKYDMVEYTMPANGLAAPSTDVDTSQENMIGLDLALTLLGSQNGSQSTGVKDGFMTQVNAAANALPSTWSSVINAQWPTRLLSPLSVQYIITSGSNTSGNASLPGFNPGTFLDSAIQSAWNNYQSPACMSVTVSSGTKDALAGKTVIGQVDSNGNFDFYNPANVTTCVANLYTANVQYIVAQIPSPFNSAFWITNVSGGWLSATGSELEENGPFLLPPTAPSTGGSVHFANTLYPISSADIGNTVATALNRGVFDPAANSAYATQPYCPSLAQLYPASYGPTQNLWATAVWGVAKNLTYGYGKAYAIPYDDKCGFSTDIQDSGARVITVTVGTN